MGTISDKLMRIINTKEDIRQALISKGYDVPTSIPFKEYAKMILDLPCNADSFPDIEGIVARYSASGLTNEQMAANPVWADKTGNGRDLQLKNFSWKGMSGVGGYGDENHQTFYKFTLDDYVFIATPPGVKHMNFTFRVTGLQPGNKLTLAFFGTTNTVYGTWNKDGIYTVDADIVEAGKPTYFYNGYSATRGEFTIEILPLYPGALVFDGVDDYGACDNFPILTKEKGYTVVALRQWITYNPNAISAIATNASDQSFNGAFTFENYNKGAEQTISYGATQISLQYSKSPFSWQTTSKYNGFNIANGNKDATNSLVLGRSYPQRNEFANFAIWELVFLDHDATEEELTKIKYYFVKTYPWLFPDQAWTVTGKTNEDTDRATIANITGNGNNLVLSNFGFAEGSGYGLYKQNFSKIQWTSPSARVEVTKTNSSFNITEVKSIAIQFYYLSNINEVAFTVPSIKVRVVGLTDGQSVNYRYFVDGVVKHFLISSDGIYDLPAFEFPAKGNYYGFVFTKIQSSCNITIEQIPEYEGYLVTDGVDDEVRSAAFTLNEDWTIVGNWEFITNENKNAGLTKVYSFYLYNRDYGIFVYKYINAGQGFSVEDVKSLKAICSDGRIYLNDWQEIRNNIEQEATISKGVMAIGYFNRDFTKMAFKNLGIYNNQLLSKDDCIKAYNYLQTLKSK